MAVVKMGHGRSGNGHANRRDDLNVKKVIDTSRRQDDWIAIRLFQMLKGERQRSKGRYSKQCPYRSAKVRKDVQDATLESESKRNSNKHRRRAHGVYRPRAKNGMSDLVDAHVVMQAESAMPSTVTNDDPARPLRRLPDIKHRLTDRRRD